MFLLEQRPLCLLAASVCSALFAVLLLVPGVIFWLFGMDHDVGGVIIARRAAMLFAGLGFLAWRVRDMPHSGATNAVFQSFSVAMGGLAVLGLVEFASGNVGPGIALTIIAEIFFAVSFARLARRIG